MVTSDESSTEGGGEVGMGATNTGGYDQALAQRLLEHSVPPSVLHDRIRQLEELNRVLAAEVDGMRSLVDAAEGWFYGYNSDDELMAAYRAYESSRSK